MQSYLLASLSTETLICSCIQRIPFTLPFLIATIKDIGFGIIKRYGITCRYLSSRSGDAEAVEDNCCFLIADYIGYFLHVIREPGGKMSARDINGARYMAIRI